MVKEAPDPNFPEDDPWWDLCEDGYIDHDDDDLDGFEWEEVDEDDEFFEDLYE